MIQRFELHPIGTVEKQNKIDDIDALDCSPVIDIKCYIPEETKTDVRLPQWVHHGAKPAH